MIQAKYYMGVQQLQEQAPEIVNRLTGQDRLLFDEIIQNKGIADESNSIQELDYFFIKKLMADNPEKTILADIFNRLDQLQAPGSFDGFNTIEPEPADLFKAGGNFDEVKGLLAFLETINQNYQTTAAKDIAHWIMNGNPNDPNNTEIVLGTVAERIKELDKFVDAVNSDAVLVATLKDDEIAKELIEEHRVLNRLMQFYSQTVQSAIGKTKTITVKIPLSANVTWQAACNVHNLPTLSDEEFLKVWKNVHAARAMQERKLEFPNYVHSRHFHILHQAAQHVPEVDAEFKKRGLDKKYTLFVEVKQPKEKLVETKNQEPVNEHPKNFKGLFPDSMVLLKMSVRDINWVQGDYDVYLSLICDPKREQIKALKKQLSESKGALIKRDLNEKIGELEFSIADVERRYHSSLIASWDGALDYLKEFVVKTGLLSENDLTDEVWGHLAGMLSDYTFTRENESFWNRLLFDVFIEIVIGYKEAQIIKLNPDYTVPVAYCAETGSEIPQPVLSIVRFVLARNKAASLCFAGYCTNPMEDVLPCWMVGFECEAPVLSQNEVMIAFDNRIKVLVLQNKTYLILPYKVGPYDLQIARAYFSNLEAALVHNDFFQKNELSLNYVSRLHWLINMLNPSMRYSHQQSSLASDTMLYIDSFTAYSKEQLIMIFTRPANGISFQVLLFGKLVSWSPDVEARLIKNDGVYKLIKSDSNKIIADGLTPENIADMIFGRSMVVLTEKNLSPVGLGSVVLPAQAEPAVVEEDLSIAVAPSAEPDKIIVEFDVPSEMYGTTTCVVNDIEHALSAHYCQCADGQDYLFNPFELQQLRDIYETGETAGFVPVTSLKYPLNWIAKCMPVDNTLQLPTERMTASEYADVKRILQKSGGTYKKNAFVFEEPGMDVYMRILAGEDYNLRKKYQYFPTPAPTADYMVKLAGIKPGMKVCEPSAGRGAIINAIHRELPELRVEYCEAMESNKKALAQIPNTQFICSDFLEIPESKYGYYDRIIANPPFSKGQDGQHIRLMYKCLSLGGRLVSVSSVHWQFAKDRASVDFKSWLSEVTAEIIEVPAGTFKESGTMIPSLIIVINKV